MNAAGQIVKLVELVGFFGMVGICLYIWRRVWLWRRKQKRITGD